MQKLLAALVILVSLPLTAQTAPKMNGIKTVKKPMPTHPVATHPTAIIDTTAGKMSCMLFPDKAPIGVANFVGLAQGTKDWTNPKTGRKMHGVPLYSGTIFHRVIPEFMIQGGDPLGNGMGDPGYKFKNETSPDLTFDRPGRLAYANAGPDTNGSQFFITEAPYPSLDGKYTIFGQCDQASVDLVKQIARMPRNESDRPDNPVKINKITILGTHSTVHHTAPAHKPVHKATTPAAK